MEQLVWRLENGELPSDTPPKVIVLAVGSNSKGMVRHSLDSVLRATFHAAVT